MLLSFAQRDSLKTDLDYIIARSACDTVQRTKSHVLAAVEHDPDVLLDLVQAMRDDDARWLSVPLDALRPLISKRMRGLSGGDHSAEEEFLLL